MSSPRIARLGHIGIHCSDLAAQEEFYTQVLGLTVTDRDDDAGLIFLSAQPEVEHHEVLLIRRIRELLYDQGFTISGARNRLDELVAEPTKAPRISRAPSLSAVRKEIESVLELMKF